jgi:diguanylate cyclase (GGDEF)-like protein
MAKTLYRHFLPTRTGPNTIASHGDICSLFLACLTVEEACSITKDWFRRQFPEISGDIALFSEKRDFLETVVSWSNKRSEGDTFRPCECWAIRRGKPHYVGANCAAGMTACNHYEREEDGWQLCLPLMASGEVLGLLHFQGPGVLGNDEVATGAEGMHPDFDLDDISESLAMAIVNLKQRETLQHQAIRDPLTQLFNRRYLEYTLERELHQATRAGEPLTMAMLDVDHFKQFNDNYGHDAGDALLKSVGAVMLKHMRRGDIACRFGGEEFAFVYPGVPEDVACARLEAIRCEIEKQSLSHRGRTCRPVTISAGIALFPDHGNDIETLINAADQALYMSKEGGRNRVTIAEGEGDDGVVAPLKLVHDSDQSATGRKGDGSAGSRNHGRNHLRNGVMQFRKS